MKHIDLYDIAFESYQRYFDRLSQVGYMKQSQVDKLIFISFLMMFLDEFHCLLSKKDIDSINEALACLFSPCIIPYPTELLIDAKPRVDMQGDIDLKETKI